MNDDTWSPITDARILGAMKAVNPPLEKLMAERFALRQEVRQARVELACAHRKAEDLLQIRDVLIPRYIAIGKLVSLAAASLTLLALAAALLTDLFEVKTTASLFASLLLPFWLVDHAEQKFGRWQVRLGKAPIFNSHRMAD